MKIFTGSAHFFRRPLWRGFFLSVVFCFPTVIRVNVFDGDSAYLRLKGSGISKALSRRVGADVKIKADLSPAVAADGPSPVAFHLSALPGRAFTNLFITHPPIADRIARLRSMRPA